MPDCKLTLDLISSSCVDLEIGGTSGKVYGINYSDWLAAQGTITRSADGTITDIALVGTGTKAIEYDLMVASPMPSTPLTVNSGGRSGFVHTLQMFLHSKEQALKKELAGKMNFGRMVWIVVLDSSIVAQVYGDNCGMSLTAYDEPVNDPSKGGGIDVTFTTPSHTLENLPPVTCFNTNRATTLDMLIALKTAVV